MERRVFKALHDRLFSALCITNESLLATRLQQVLQRWDEKINCIVSAPSLISDESDNKL